MYQGYQIPFNRPSFAGNELKYISEAIASGHASGDGKFTHQCHTWLEDNLKTQKALLTTSC
ncbi:MAG: dTDP-4-amino-4,6-dideoxygalactose transaminase, partial [Anaerolineales bacterium]|nr:dTDP-4-amino-4,6-dideoxygalactose transaminase [Anaerolineales bacterium]